MSPRDWHLLIRLYALQEYPTPSRLALFLADAPARFQKILSETVEESVAIAEKHMAEGTPFPKSERPHRPPLPLHFEKKIEPGAKFSELKVTMSVCRDLWLHSLHHIVTKTYIPLTQLRWKVLSAPANTEWLTSDHPAICVFNEKFWGRDPSIGWLTPGAEHFMPLSPTKMLYSRVGTKVPTRGFQVSKDVATSLNELTIRRAHHAIFARTETALVGLIRQRTVDLEAFQDEWSQWENFHEEHRRATQPDVTQETVGN